MGWVGKGDGRRGGTLSKLRGCFGGLRFENHPTLTFCNCQNQQFKNAMKKGLITVDAVNQEFADCEHFVQGVCLYTAALNTEYGNVKWAP